MFNKKVKRVNKNLIFKSIYVLDVAFCKGLWLCVNKS